MRYISTRGDAPELTFDEAMLTGLARDGGLYVPAEIPQMSHGDIAALAGLPYEEVAFRVMRPFVGESFTDEEFRVGVKEGTERAFSPGNYEGEKRPGLYHCKGCGTAL
ncbi:MAG: peptide-methionine (R)-S-oxide reductase, partial [Pseudomonadota bacterium]